MFEGQTPRHRRRQHSYVYFIQGADKVKIGLAVNPEDRLTQLQCGSPVPLQIVGLIQTDTPLQTEAELHRRFARYRKHLEWFEYSHEIRLYIERYASLTPKKRPYKTKNPYEKELLAALAHGEWMTRTALFIATGRVSWPKNLEKALNALIGLGLIESRPIKLPQNGKPTTQYRLKGEE